nr:MAG TPA: hypothetical protein [Caudoviricetes sp.]
MQKYTIILNLPNIFKEKLLTYTKFLYFCSIFT